MSYHSGRGEWPPRSSISEPSHPIHQLNGNAVPWLLGRLMDASDRTIASLSRIEQRLETVDARMDVHEGRIAALETAPRPAVTAPDDQPSRIERLVMRWASFLLPLAAVLGTGTEKDVLEISKALVLATLK